jgi:hypothetical protein
MEVSFLFVDSRVFSLITRVGGCQIYHFTVLVNHESGEVAVDFGHVHFLSFVYVVQNAVRVFLLILDLFAELHFIIEAQGPRVMTEARRSIVTPILGPLKTSTGDGGAAHGFVLRVKLLRYPFLCIGLEVGELLAVEKG